MNKKLPIAALVIIILVLLLSMAGCYGDMITISFDTLGGNNLPSVSVSASATGLTLPVPEKEGFQFSYWCYDSELTQRVDTSVIPTENTTFYAKWTAKLVTVTFITTNPLTQEVSRKYAYVSYGGNLPTGEMPEIAEIDGYEGIWLTNGLTSVTAPQTIYARYSIKKNFVKYFVGEEEYASYLGEPQTQIASPNAPSKDGYYFAGWYYGENNSSRLSTAINAIPEQSITLYARFIDISETSRFFTYITDQGNIKITGLTSVGKAQKEIVIPSQINGDSVSSIGYAVENSSANSLSVFNSETLETVVIPQTVTSIGSFAFYGAFNLKDVIVEGSGLVTIGTGAFAGCLNLVSFNLPVSTTNIGKYSFAGMKIDNTADSGIEFSGEGSWSVSDKWINTDMAFSALNITSESRLSVINNYAFYNLVNFTRINLPKTLTAFNYLAFLHSGIEYVDAYQGGNFISYRGAVYSADGRTLVYYPLRGASSFALKEGTTAIASYAFYDNKNIASLTEGSTLITIGAYAFFQCENLTSISLEGNTALTTVGTYAFSKSKIASFNFPSGFTTLGQGAFKNASYLAAVSFAGQNISSIAQDAFYACTALANITLPRSVSIIGKNAFFGCSNLLSVSFGENSLLNTIDEYAFADCVKIATLSLPTSIRTINKYAFAGISGKMNLDLSSVPSELITLGDYAFFNTKLTNFTVNSNLINWGIGVFKNCASLTRFTITVSEYISAIPEETLYGCTSLTQIIFPYTILEIKDYALYNCTNLSGVTFSLSSFNDGITTIGKSAFEGCVNLKSGDAQKRILPITITSLGERAFYNCSKITAIYIPSSLNIISKQAFAYCSALTEIRYDTNSVLETIGEEAFANCTSLVSARLPSSLSPRNDEESGCVKNPFIGCTSLISFVLDNSATFSVLEGVVYQSTASGMIIYLYPTGKTGAFAVNPNITAIDNYAFYGAELTSLTFTSSPPVEGVENINLVKIGASAFAKSSLTSASLSKRVYQIEEYAFAQSLVTTLSIESTFVSTDNANYNIINTGISDNSLNIGNYAFFDTKINYLSIPERTTSISEGSFAYCYDMKTLSFTGSDNFVLTIGDYAYFGNNNLKTIAFPRQLTSIGNYAFGNCFNVSAISFNYSESLGLSLTIGQYAFSNNHYLYSVSLPTHLANLGEGVFSNNSRLTEVIFAQSINATTLALPKLAFFGSNSLKTINLPNYISEIGEKAFWKTKIENITLNNGTALAIMDYAFSETTLLKTIYFPENITSIGNYAFFNSNLEAFSFSESGEMISILSYAFYGTPLTEITLSSRVQSLGDHSFAHTESLIGATIHAGITAIGNNAFENSSITSVTLDSSVIEIGDYAFAYTPNLEGISGAFSSIGDYAFYHSGIAYYNSLSMLNSLSIGISSFAFCNNLTSLNIQTSGNAQIGDYAFAESATLSVLDIEGSFTSIGSGIAYNSTSLSDIAITDNGGKYSCIEGVLYYNFGGEVILIQYPVGRLNATYILPQTATEIGDYAFYGNKTLLSIITKSEDVIGKGAYSFARTNANLKIYVAETLVENYKEQWQVSNVSYLTEDFEGFVLKYLGNDTYSIIDYIGSESTLTIPGLITITGEETTVNYRIIYIESHAFENNVNLQNVTIASGIREICDYAFANCINLTNINLGNNLLSIKNYSFLGCTSLQTVTFGSSLVSIGNYAFQNCSSLLEICLPDSVTSVGNYAFSRATSLSSIYLGGGLQSIGNNALEYINIVTIIMPSTLSFISDNVFFGCENLTYVYLMSREAPRLKSLNAFRNTPESLQFFVFGNNINNYTSDIQWRNFSSRILSGDSIVPASESEDRYYAIEKISGNNYRLLSYIGIEETITIDSSLSPEINITEIGRRAIGHFAKTVTLGEGITSLNKYSFANAKNLTTINLPASLTAIGEYSFSNLQQLKNVTFNNFSSSNLSTIANYAFYNTERIQSFNFPAKLQSIGDYAFAKTGENRLSQITFSIPSTNQISIGSYAFANNAMIKQIVFDCAVSSLGEGAFSNCANLEAIYFNSLGTIVTEINSAYTKVFENCYKLNVFLPSSAKYTAFSNAWTNNTDKSKLALASSIARDTIDIIGQEGFVISVNSGSNTASIINYLGTDTEVTFPSTVTINQNTYTITKIGREAGSTDVISGYVIGRNVTKVIIPSTVTTIAADAFRNSRLLSVVEISSGSGLETIGKNAFANCKNLTTINIPKNIVVIENSAFADCINLNNITFDNRSINDPVKKLVIMEKAFYGCSSLTSITLPLHTDIIGNYGFANCINLNSAVFTEESKITKFGKYAFSNTAIVSIYVPFSVNSVDDYCFLQSASLRYVYLNRETIPGISSSLTAAGEQVFGVSSSPFIKVYAPSTSYTSYQATKWNVKTIIPNIAQGDFNYIVNPSGAENTVTLTNYLGDSTLLSIPSSLLINNVEHRVTTLGRYLGNEKITEVRFAENNYVTALESYSFAACSSLTKIHMPANITTIGDYSFYNCSSLSDVILPNNLSNIQPYVFAYCTSLKEITITPQVITIGNFSFIGCSSLSRVIVNIVIGESLNALGQNAFSGTSSSLVILVNESDLSRYVTEWRLPRIISKDSMAGDFVLQKNGQGYSLIQYNGNADIDLTSITFFGGMVNEIAVSSITDSNVRITIDDTVIYYPEIEDRITIID